MPKIIIENPIICSFYEANPKLSCENMNLVMIEMINNLQNTGIINNNNNNSNNNPEMTVIKEHIKETISNSIGNLDLKTTMMLQNIQQPLYSFITNSEERINKNITSMKEIKPSSQEEYSTLLKDITHIVNKESGNDVINNIRSTFNKLYTSAEVRTVDLPNTDEAVTMKRFRCPDVLIQLNTDEYNIESNQIDQLYKNVSDFNYSGIIISQSSGFSGKTDFHIDIHNGNVIVFIHNYNNNDLKPQMAVNIIDNVMKHITQTKNPTDTTVHIPKDILDQINNEYRLFISQKSAVVEILKDTQKKVISQMDEIKFPFLEKYLSTKFVAPVCNSGLKCDVCKNYSANNLKALAAHKRGCLRKHPHYSKGGKPTNCDKENITNCM